MSGLTEYVSHKVVRAAKITHVEVVDYGNAVRVSFRLPNGNRDYVELPKAWADKHEPQVGDYYVVYADGYAFWSPAEAFEQVYTPADQNEDDTVEQIARMAHEVNRAYCQALGDDSQPAWEDAPDWQKQSAIAGVNLHLSGEHGPEASHEAWMAQKVADGWVYGETKDAEAKKHPCLVPFGQLPREQQAKDYLFRGVVRAARGDS